MRQRRKHKKNHLLNVFQTVLKGFRCMDDVRGEDQVELTVFKPLLCWVLADIQGCIFHVGKCLEVLFSGNEKTSRDIGERVFGVQDSFIGRRQIFQNGSSRCTRACSDFENSQIGFAMGQVLEERGSIKFTVRDFGVSMAIFFERPG